MHVYERALERELVPTYVIGGRGYWAHPQVIELVAYVRALVNPLDTEALYALLLSPLCGLSLDGLVLDAAGAAAELGELDRACLAAFEGWFEQERRAAAWLGAEQVLDRALAHSGYELHIAGLPDARRRLANVRKLMRFAREWQAGHGSDLRGFVDLLQARAVGGERESEAPVEGEALDAVRLMTIHRSKGLEFPVVCLADLGRQVVPRAGALVKVGRDGESLGLRLRRPGFAERVNVLAYDQVKVHERELELAEERRLFYVAMTRAKERLIVSGAAKLEGWADSNRFAPIGWVGAAFVPDMATRAAAADPRSVRHRSGRARQLRDGRLSNLNLSTFSTSRVEKVDRSPRRPRRRGAAAGPRLTSPRSGPSPTPPSRSTSSAATASTCSACSAWPTPPRLPPLTRPRRTRLDPAGAHAHDSERRRPRHPDPPTAGWPRPAPALARGRDAGGRP